jgi:hypothetical protein
MRESEYSLPHYKQTLRGNPICAMAKREPGLSFQVQDRQLGVHRPNNSLVTALAVAAEGAGSIRHLGCCSVFDLPSAHYRIELQSGGVHGSKWDQEREPCRSRLN